jgi:hypothetical protein
VLSPLWVEESIKEGRRLLERKYLIARPKERDVLAPHSSAAVKVHRKRNAAPPKPVAAFDLDGGGAMFSSSQIIQGEVGGALAAGGEEVSSPAARRQRRRRASALAAAATESLATLPQFGAETQAVANILVVDLPDPLDLDDEDLDELDTPLSVRYPSPPSIHGLGSFACTAASLPCCWVCRLCVQSQPAPYTSRS